MNDADKFHQKIINRLQEERKARGLSHQKLADMAGITRPAISFMESGKRNPSMLLVLKVCSALEIKLKDIL